MTPNNQDALIDRIIAHLLHLNMPVTFENVQGALENHRAPKSVKNRIEVGIERNVIAYMQQVIERHLDCGEVNCTSLAEDACQHFEVYGPEPQCEVPEDYFEWSFTVSQWYERKRQ